MGNKVAGAVDVGLRQLAHEVDALSPELQRRLQEIIAETERQLEELGASPLGRAVATDESRRAEIKLEASTGQTHLRRAARDAQRPLRAGLEHLGKHPELLRDGIYNIGKAMGVQFRPWQAVNAGKDLAKVAGKLGAALPFLGMALDGYFAYQAETAEDKRRTELARARTGIHRTFAEQGENEAEALREAANDLRKRTLDAAEAEAEKSFTDVCASQHGQQALAARLSATRSSLRSLQAVVLGTA